MFWSQSSDHHQESITVLVQLLLIGVHASLYSGMWLYVVCAYYVPVCVVSGCVLHHTDTTRTGTSYAQTQITYGHIPEYNEACTPISSNCTSTVIDP